MPKPLTGTSFAVSTRSSAGLLRVGGEIAEGESCPVVRRADDAQPQRVGGNRVRAVLLRAGELGDAVDLAGPRADRLSGGGRGGERRMVGDVEHRLDDLLVTGAAAQHAGERVLDLGLVRLAIAREQVGRRHQHARGADAALRRAVVLERYLKRRELAVLRQAFDRDDVCGPPPARARSGRRRPGARRAARCRPRNRRRCSRSWCRSGPVRRAARRRGARRAARGSPPCAR